MREIKKYLTHDNYGKKINFKDYVEKFKEIKINTIHLIIMFVLWLVIITINVFFKPITIWTIVIVIGYSLFYIMLEIINLVSVRRCICLDRELNNDFEKRVNSLLKKIEDLDDELNK